MTFDQLQYFAETARRQHIGQAARFLGISPSAISHSIAALEDELGRKLFEKHGRQIRLTPHGKLLLDRAEFLISEAGRVRDELAADKLEMRGHHRIAATHMLAGSFVAPAWIGLQNEHPGLSATLHSLRSGEVLARVSAGEIDLGVCLSPHSGPNHEQELLHEGRLVFAFRKGHPFLKNRRMDELARYPSIAALAAQGIENCENHPSFQRFRLAPRIAVYYDSYEVAIEALKAGQGWTLMPDIVANAHGSELETFVPRGWDGDYRIAAVWPKNRIRSQALDHVVDDVRARVRRVAAGRSPV